MDRIKDFNDLAKRLRTQPQKMRVVVPCPDDRHTQQVLERALEQNIADVTVVIVGNTCDWAHQMHLTFGNRVKIFCTVDVDSAAAFSVELVYQGMGDVLMKGRLNTDNLLRAVLRKQRGLLEPGHVLSHLSLASVPSYGKLLLFTDAAVIPHPTLEQFRAMITYGVDACRNLGVRQPLVALINCNEKISEKFPNTLAFATLKREAAEGLFGNAVVDGPMDVKTACNSESAQIKGISSAVAGNADMLVFPNIQAGNTFYKAITLFASATIAGVLCGTVKPVVVTSRADSAESKFNSLALACVLSQAKKVDEK